MTIAHKIIHARDFIKTTASGELDLARSRDILRRIAEENKPPADYDILLDLRGVTNELADDDFYQLEDALCEHREAFQNKLAVLHSGRRSDRAQYMEDAWRSRGYDVAHFTDFEMAMNWLSEVTYFHIDYDPTDGNKKDDAS